MPEVLFPLISSFHVVSSISPYPFLLLLGPNDPSESDGGFDGSGDPQGNVYLAHGFRDPSAGNGSQQHKYDSSNSPITDRVLRQRSCQIGIGGEVVYHGSDDYRGCLEEAELTSSTSLARSLETKEYDWNLLHPFDIGEDVVDPALDDAFLDNCGGDDDD